MTRRGREAPSPIIAAPEVEHVAGLAHREHTGFCRAGECSPLLLHFEVNSDKWKCRSHRQASLHFPWLPWPVKTGVPWSEPGEKANPVLSPYDNSAVQCRAAFSSGVQRDICHVSMASCSLGYPFSHDFYVASYSIELVLTPSAFVL